MTLTGVAIGAATGLSASVVIDLGADDAAAQGAEVTQEDLKQTDRRSQAAINGTRT